MPAWVTSPVYEKVIDSLIQARRDAGLTQRALAQKVRKPQSFIAKVETRERNLSVLEFIGLAKAMGVEPGDLLARSSDGLPSQIEF